MSPGDVACACDRTTGRGDWPCASLTAGPVTLLVPLLANRGLGVGVPKMVFRTGGHGQ
jgi:hypothetical protein